MNGPADWAASGAMSLTGRPGGPPLVSPGNPASFVRERLARLHVSISGLLSERAAYTGLVRSGPWSCGGAFRVLATADGHFGLSLPRGSDLEMLPALVEREQVTDPWAAVSEWAAATSTSAVESRVRLLGLAGGHVPTEPPNDRAGVMTKVLGSRTVSMHPLVVDLTSLWAGPLCAHLLSRHGARVLKVESRLRPDGARRGSPSFYELLHVGHEEATLDFGADLDDLKALIDSADLVLEGSRPRALQQLGIVAEDVVSRGTSWISITAHGRSSDAIGFGDDVAVAAGLYVRDGDDILPCGDALADPLAGVAAAVAAAEALRSTESRLIDVSMLHVAAQAAAGPSAPYEVVQRSGSWWLVTDEGIVPVAQPMRRP